MIVRISTEAQYDLPDDVYDELNGLDNAVVAAVEADDEPAFTRSFAALLDFVRAKGAQVDDESLEESALILPPPDLTLTEAERDFTGDGILPD